MPQLPEENKMQLAMQMLDKGFSLAKVTVKYKLTPEQTAILSKHTMKQRAEEIKTFFRKGGLDELSESDLVKKGYSKELFTIIKSL
jgi:hypothetical protein